MKDITANRHQGADTSVQAFRQIRETLSERQQKVLTAIERADPAKGLTCDELAHDLNVSPNQISGRFTELKKRRLIRSIGRRLTAQGCTARAYVRA
jgi:FixJ family two-component response regulator